MDLNQSTFPDHQTTLEEELIQQFQGLLEEDSSNAVVNLDGSHVQTHTLRASLSPIQGSHRN